MVRCVTLTLAYADYVYQSGCYSMNYLDHHTYVKGRSPVWNFSFQSHIYTGSMRRLRLQTKVGRRGDLCI